MSAIDSNEEPSLLNLGWLTEMRMHDLLLSVECGV